MSPVLQFLLVLLLAVLAGSKVTVQGFMSRKHIRTAQDNLWFNSLLFLIIAVLMALIFSVGQVTGTIVFYAVLAGLCNIGFQYCYAIALRTGPVSLTVLIGNFYVLVTTGFSCLYFGENLYPTQLVAIALLVTSMILTTESKPDEKKATRKWVILPLICMGIAAFDGICQKFFLRTEDALLANAQSTQLALGYLIASGIGFMLYFLKARRGEKSPLGFKRPILLYTLAVGLLLALYRRFNMYALSVVEATFLFPTYAGLNSLLMMLSGIILFKDKLSRKQTIGLICGIASVVLMNLRLGIPLT